jgi:hypothetical protein
MKDVNRETRQELDIWHIFAYWYFLIEYDEVDIYEELG